MEAEDMQKPMPIRKVALRELPNGCRNATDKRPGDTPVLKDRGLSLEFPKISGVKRCHPDCALKLPNGHVSCLDADGLLEHQRRKKDGEPCKVSMGFCSSIDDTLKLHSCADSDRGLKPTTEGSRVSQKPVASFSTFIPVPISSTAQSLCPLAAHSEGNPVTGFPTAVSDHSNENTETLGSQVSKLHWKERFIQLQALLKAYDQSGQEDYISMLRSLSAPGRSKHAVELEKRAIQLLIEEGRELSRMKVLNVLGKSSPTGQTPVTSQK